MARIKHIAFRWAWSMGRECFNRRGFPNLSRPLWWMRFVPTVTASKSAVDVSFRTPVFVRTPEYPGYVGNYWVAFMPYSGPFATVALKGKFRGIRIGRYEITKYRWGFARRYGEAFGWHFGRWKH